MLSFMDDHFCQASVGCHARFCAPSPKHATASGSLGCRSGWMIMPREECISSFPRKTCWLLVRHVTSISQYHPTNLLCSLKESKSKEYRKQITEINPDINRQHPGPNGRSEIWASTLYLKKEKQRIRRQHAEWF